MEISKEDNNGSSYITCISYIYYLPGDKIVTDLIIGNSRGDIGLVTCGKFILLKKEAHKGMINNIKITDAIHDVELCDVETHNSDHWRRRVRAVLGHWVQDDIRV